jgi:hypothetical protein
VAYIFIYAIYVPPVSEERKVSQHGKSATAGHALG